MPVTWGRYRLDVASDDRSIPPTSVTFDAGFYADASADTPDLLEIALDKSEFAAGDTMNVAVTARTAGKVTHQRGRRPAAGDADRRRAGRHGEDPAQGRQRLGLGRLCGGDAAPSARRGGEPHAGPRDRPAMVLGRQKGAHARVRDAAAEPDAPERRAARAGQARRAQRRARRRGSPSRRSTSASSTSPTTSRRRRTTSISASAGSPRRSATSTGNCSTACRARAARSAPAATVRPLRSAPRRRRSRRSRCSPAS